MNRIPLALTAAGAIVALLPATGAANVGATCADQVVTVALTGWNPGPNALEDLTVTVGGQTARSGPFGFDGPDFTFTVPAPAAGELVATTRRFGVVHVSPPGQSCAPVAVTPSPVAIVSPGTPPGPVEISPGPVESPGTITGPRRPSRPPVRLVPRAPRYRCPAPLPSKAWQRIILRRHGVRCPLRHPKPPMHVAVLGERR